MSRVVDHFRQHASAWAVAVLVAATGWIHLASLDAPIWNMDEAFTAVSARTILEGGLLYRDAVDHRAPLTNYAFALAFAIGGGKPYDMAAVHLMFAVLTAVLAALVALLGRRLAGPRAGALATGWFFLMGSFSWPYIDLLAFHTEWLMILFESCALLAFLHGLETARCRWYFVSGLAFGVAFLTKQPAAGTFAVCAAFLPFFAWLARSGRAFPRSPILAGWASMGAGFAIPIVLVLAFYRAEGALEDFGFYFWVYNKDYYAGILEPEWFWYNLDLLTRETTSWCGMGLLLAAGGAVAGGRFSGLAFADEGRDDARQALLIPLAATSFLAAVAPCRGFGHYFIQTFPSWSMLAGIALDALLRRFWDRPAGEEPGRRGLERRLLLVMLLGWILGVPLVTSVKLRFKEYRDYLVLPNPALDRLAARIRETTAPDDTLFVWGFWPEIYILGERRAGSRFSYCTFVTGLIPWANGAPGVDTSRWRVPGSLEQLVEDLTTKKPALIIDTSPGGCRFWGKYPLDAFPEISGLVGRDYEPVVIDPEEATQFRVFRRITSGSPPSDPGAPGS